MKTKAARVKLDELFDLYGPLALEHLSLTNWRREDELDSWREELKIHFLFPNVPDYGRAELHAMLLFRLSYNWAVNVPGLNADEIEPHFMALKQAILESDYYPSLTPLQEEILNSEFFTIEFR